MSTKKISIEGADYRAMIFDMDGILTRTAALHAQAWKKMFDGVLRRQGERTGHKQRPFDIVEDYRAYVDGKPRLEGLRSFLESRGIELPRGKPSDAAQTETIYGLGELKNQIFQGLVEHKGVETFPGSVLLAAQAKIAGLRTAVVTSSKNGPLIMERSGLMPLFDALVDGNVAAELSLSGKPDPDIMIEAARRLGVDPGEAVLFEDALSGVQAGKAAAMGLVVGVARAENNRQLREGGADLVVNDLSLVRFLPTKPRSSADLGSALDDLDAIRAVSAHVPQTAIFLDYDGTLTPIVDRPELAKLDDVTRSTVSRLGERYLVAVISGRDLTDVRFLVDLDNLYYAGSHGFEIAGPGNMHSLVEQGEDYLSVIEKVDRELHEHLDDIGGVLLERKRLSVAVHFRLASAEAEPEVSEAVDKVVSRHPGLRRSEGKKVIEIQPDIDWHKGRAMEWLMERLEVDPSVSLVLYVGDDLTDEDAFRALHGCGVGIIVQNSVPRETYADLAVNDTTEVRALLEALVGSETDGQSPAGAPEASE